MTDSSLIFYTNPQSRSRIVRWMLEEVKAVCGAKANYETKLLEYGPDMKSESYLAINPMGKVPAISHKGVVVTECAAICAYLADAFLEAKLAPPIDQRGSYYRWLFFAAGPLESAITNQSLAIEIPKEKQRMVGYGNYDFTMDALAKAVSGSTYIAGENFTAADVYVGSHIGWGLQFKTIPAKREFVDYWEKIANRPAGILARKLDDEMIKKV